MDRVIFKNEAGTFRIREIEDQDFDIANLKGDVFNPDVNTDIPRVELIRQEREFERQVGDCGVWGYVLEMWNPIPDKGWEQIDSCFGFVGRYGEKNQHYIVEELKNQIK